jgi:predicted transcriptional regulator
LEKPSVQAIQEALSDDKGLFIFKAFDRTSVDICTVKANFTRKQFYSRLSKLSNAQLIKGKRGYYHLTSLGVLVRELLQMLEVSISEFHNLRAVDETSEQLEERINQIDRLIVNQAVKKILIQGFSRYQVNTTTMNHAHERLVILNLFHFVRNYIAPTTGGIKNFDIIVILITIIIGNEII